MELDIHRVENDPVEERKTELVERKGLGHPDSISDGIAESVSQALSKEYMDRSGHILHHNTDEVQLIAGSSSPRFGGGETDDKIYVLLGGRATRKHDGQQIPVDRIAKKAAKNYIEENFKALKPEHIEFESRIGETSTDLQSVFSRENVPLSNDTSFGVGHAPLSQTEKTVKKAEKKVREIGEVGEDVKIMGLRRGDNLHVTVASAVISERVAGLDEYREVLKKVRRETEDIAKAQTSLDVDVDVNMADGESEDSVYLTVTGTSAEMGDDGSVGRGNRCNGLITPHRSMSLEAASGKNPVSHVGKIYNLQARKLAESVEGFAEVKILSQIGSPIDSPKAIELVTDSDESSRVLKESFRNSMDNVGQIAEEIVEEKLTTF